MRAREAALAEGTCHQRWLLNSKLAPCSTHDRSALGSDNAARLPQWRVHLGGEDRPICGAVRRTGQDSCLHSTCQFRPRPRVALSEAISCRSSRGHTAARPPPRDKASARQPPLPPCAVARRRGRASSRAGSSSTRSATSAPLAAPSGMPGLASRRGARAQGALTLWLVAALHLAGPAAADDPSEATRRRAGNRRRLAAKLPRAAPPRCRPSGSAAARGSATGEVPSLGPVLKARTAPRWGVWGGGATRDALPPRWRTRRCQVSARAPFPPAPASPAVQTKLTVAAYRQRIWDLEDKADSTYDKLKDEDKVWDSECSQSDPPR